MGKKTLTEAQIENIEMRTETELELIRTIVEEMHFMVERDEPLSDKNKNRYIIVVEALEKQIPKKPCRISEIDENDNALVECPICHAGNDYAINRIKSSYCWNCGQKLDWETDC